MLARRVVTRPATTIRRLGHSQLQKRFTYLSGSHLQALPRPNTWLAKLRFRPDGKPRSKPIALGFGSFILFSLLSFLTLNTITDDEDETFGLLVKMMFVQQTDIAYYDSVNFDDPISTLSYFKKLYLSFTWDTKMDERTFNDLMKLVTNRKIQGLSKKTAEAQVQHIMRSAAEKIHGALQGLDRDSESIVNTANFVSLAIHEALNGLIGLMFSDETLQIFNVQIRDHNKMDAGVSKEYEVLG